MVMTRIKRGTLKVNVMRIRWQFWDKTVKSCFLILDTPMVLKLVSNKRNENQNIV